MTPCFPFAAEAAGKLVSINEGVGKSELATGPGRSGGRIPVNAGNHCCPVKSRKESVGWHFRRNWRFGRWPEVRI